MVYAHGVGVRTMPWIAPTGVRRSPSVLSAPRPPSFLHDAVKGLAWLIRRTVRAFSGRQPVSRGAFAIDGIDRPGAPAIGQRSDETDT